MFKTSQSKKTERKIRETERKRTKTKTIDLLSSTHYNLRHLPFWPCWCSHLVGRFVGESFSRHPMSSLLFFHLSYYGPYLYRCNDMLLHVWARARERHTLSVTHLSLSLYLQIIAIFCVPFSFVYCWCVSYTFFFSLSLNSTMCIFHYLSCIRCHLAPVARLES